MPIVKISLMKELLSIRIFSFYSIKVNMVIRATATCTYQEERTAYWSVSLLCIGPGMGCNGMDILCH
jgi:hypothetical protein